METGSVGLLSWYELFYLVDLSPTNNPYGLDQVSERMLCSQTDSAVKVLTQEVSVIWNCPVKRRNGTID